MTSDERAKLSPEELADFQKRLADFRKEIDDDLRWRNSVSPAFAEDFAALAKAVRNSLKIPDTETPPLPSVQELARAWGTRDLVEYRAQWLIRQTTLYQALAAHPASSSVLVDHLRLLRGVGAPEQPKLAAMAEATGDWDRKVLAALALMSALEFVFADAAFIEEVHRVWSRARDDLGIRTDDGKPLPHPLAPMIEGWLRWPVAVEPNEKADRIVPSRLAMVKHNDRRAPKLWSPAAHLALVEGDQQFLPGFECEDVKGPMLPTEIYDLGEPESRRGGGRGAQLSLRLFFHSASSVRPEDRGGHRPALLRWTLREIRDELYPGRKISAQRVLDQVLRAAETLDSMDGLIPYVDLETGRWRRRRIVSVVDVPQHAADLDDFVVVSVFLPAGMESGGDSPADAEPVGREVRASVSHAPQLDLSLVAAWTDSLPCQRALVPQVGPAGLSRDLRQAPDTARLPDVGPQTTAAPGIQGSRSLGRARDGRGNQADPQSCRSWITGSFRQAQVREWNS